jgi:hypothetical protein
MPNPAATIAFTPSEVDASRTPTSCGVANPPFMSGDSFGMSIIGSKATAPYNGLSIGFRSPVEIGVPLMLAVGSFNGPPGSGNSQDASGSGIYFQYRQGSDAREIDTGAFDSVTVTVVVMPEKDGDPLSIHVRIDFVDGRVLDKTFSGPLRTLAIGCGSA